MDKSEQTDEIKVRLYRLTFQFVLKYQPKYYKQMDFSRETYEDLVSEFYCSFLTEKSRVKGKEQSLLDKFDPSVTTLEYLVKVSVQRKLIDYSRRHPYRYVSVDFKREQLGDSVLKAFNLIHTTEVSVDDREFTVSDVEALKFAFSRLNDYSKKVVADKYEEIQNVMAPAYRDVIKQVISNYTAQIKEKVVEIQEYFAAVIDELGNEMVFPMQQLTDKTAVVLIGSDYYLFDRYTGKSRQRGVMKELNISSIEEYNNTRQVLKPFFSREEFVKQHTKEGVN